VERAHRRLTQPSEALDTNHDCYKFLQTNHRRG
jgi:hypothetical protein